MTSLRLISGISARTMVLALALLSARATGKIAAQVARSDTTVAREIAVRALRSYYNVRTSTGGALATSWADRTRPEASAAAVNRTLDSAVKLAPRDSTIAALRVWHRIMTANYALADSMAADACAARVWIAWWCSAVRGFTKYNLGDGAAAAKYFDAALESMPQERRCLWSDVSFVLNDLELTDRVKRLACDKRSELNAVIWWLSDPLWMVPGNERRNGHYARWTEATLADSELRYLKYRELPSDRMHDPLESFLRLGVLHVFLGYDLGCGDNGVRLDCRGDYLMTGRMDRFMPWAAAVSDPFAAGVLDYLHASRYGGVWSTAGAEVRFRAPSVPRLVDYDAAGELFRSSSGHHTGTIQDAQVGMVLRRRGPLLLAAYDPRFAWQYKAGDRYPNLPDPASARGWAALSSLAPAASIAPIVAAVAASRGPGDSIRVSQPVHVLVGEVARVSVQLDADTDSALVSVEGRTLASGDWPVASRHRFAVFRPGLESRGALKSSDVMLYRQPENLAQPRNSDEALAWMLPRSTIGVNEQVGIYWEVYGLTAGDEPEFELSMLRADGGSSRSVRGTGLASDGASNSVRFKAPPVANGDIGADSQKAFTMQLNLKALKPGMYVMQMTTTSGGNRVTVRRDVRVIE